MDQSGFYVHWLAVLQQHKGGICYKRQRRRLVASRRWTRRRQRIPEPPSAPSLKNADLTGQQFRFCDLQKPQQPSPETAKAVVIASPVRPPTHRRHER
ncbi:hypothetical protein MRB53_024398 [Persea americana]|uniref:Uncharacterized protein n=1 Tax=Persea americana TaxID=3435 RepID=A0ACC2LCM9_PERAE|nr:hypothetical protein MRB53_024398 [Persea americana]